MNRQQVRHATGCAGFGMICVLAVVSFLHGGAQPQARAQEGTPFSADVALATPTRTPTPINVGNFVWSDLDADGRQDAGEPGLAGVTVQLWNSTKTALIDSAVTNANGNYTLVAPTPGNYRVRALLSSGDQFSPKDSAAAGDLLDSDINPSGTSFGFTDIYVFGSNLISITSIDVGIIKFFTPTPTRTPTPINIGNFIWDDANNNGRQDAGELGVANVTVQLWNSTKTALIYQTVTNANGNYTVVAPTPGNYRVRVLLGIGSSFAPKDAGIATDQTDSDCNTAGADLGFTDVFNLASNVISTVIYDCGLRGPYTPATATTQPTATSTSTPTATPTLDVDITVVPPPENEVNLPIVVR
jgi:hypothetical protein